MKRLQCFDLLRNLAMIFEISIEMNRNFHKVRQKDTGHSIR
jgi:hypothetical protein